MLLIDTGRKLGPRARRRRQSARDEQYRIDKQNAAAKELARFVGRFKEFHPTRELPADFKVPDIIPPVFEEKPRPKRVASRASRLRREYDMTETQYREMLAQQQGCCAICAVKMESPHVDHCHVTGQVRGMLCRSCNHGLGNFRDNIQFLMNAAKYLTDVEARFGAETKKKEIVERLLDDSEKPWPIVKLVTAGTGAACHGRERCSNVKLRRATPSYAKFCSV